MSYSRAGRQDIISPLMILEYSTILKPSKLCKTCQIIDFAPLQRNIIASTCLISKHLKLHRHLAANHVLLQYSIVYLTQYKKATILLFRLLVAQISLGYANINSGAAYTTQAPFARLSSQHINHTRTNCCISTYPSINSPNMMPWT
jgi:hypothetical protein